MFLTQWEQRRHKRLHYWRTEINQQIFMLNERWKTWKINAVMLKKRKHLHHPTTYIEKALLSEMREKNTNSTKTPSIHFWVYTCLWQPKLINWQVACNALQRNVTFGKWRILTPKCSEATPFDQSYDQSHVDVTQKGHNTFKSYSPDHSSV